MVRAALPALIAVAFGSEIVWFLNVAVPVVAPIVSVVAAPPTLSVVAPVLKTLAVAAVVVNEPPFNAAFPLLVISPLVPLTEKLVPVILPVPIAIALTILGSDRSSAVVIAPPPEEIILIPAGKVLEAFWLSRRIN